MSKWERVLNSSRNNPRAVRFDDLCGLLEHWSFELVRSTGSHRIYRRVGLPLINLRVARDEKAKPYQVKQVLSVLDEMFGMES